MPTPSSASAPSNTLSPLKRRLLWLVERRWLHYIVLACAMTLVAQKMRNRLEWPDYIDHAELDTSFHRRGTRAPVEVATKLPYTKDIIIVELNHELPRSIIMQLLQKLAQAKVVALDLMFVDREAELSSDEVDLYRDNIKSWRAENETLARQIRANGNVVLGTWPEDVKNADPDHPGTTRVTRIWQKPPTVLWNSARYHAHLSVRPDFYDGITRDVMPLLQTPENTPCLGLAAAAAARNIPPERLNSAAVSDHALLLGNLRWPLLDDNSMLIDYVGDRRCFKYETKNIAVNRALELTEPEDFKDAIVFVGETDFKAKDDFTTPFLDMPGVMVHANIAATLLSPQGPPSMLPEWLTMALALGCCLLLVVPLLRLSLLSCLVLAIVEVVVLAFAANSIFVEYHRVIPVSVPIIALALTYNGIAIYEYARARGVLAKFVGPEMLSRTLHLSTHLKLGGNMEEASAFFADLRGYSTLSEFLSPEAVTRVLNEYTDTLVKIVKKHKGRPIDYLGDGVFVLFEPALTGREHALNAVNAALECQEVFTRMRYTWLADGVPSLEVGIAIHSGQMVIGVVGAEQHMKLGAVGDVVNVAARVQGLSKVCGYDVLITSETHDRLKNRIPVHSCGSYAVKGREQPVEVYGVGAPREPEAKIES